MNAVLFQENLVVSTKTTQSEIFIFPRSPHGGLTPQQILQGEIITIVGAQHPVEFDQRGFPSHQNAATTLIWVHKCLGGIISFVRFFYR